MSCRRNPVARIRRNSTYRACRSNGGPVDILSMIDLWRERATEVNAQAEQFQDGSISNIVLLSIAESYVRLARREESFVAAASRQRR